MFDLTGKTALVTGSSRGIGRAVLLALASHGARVILHCRKPCPAADEALAAVHALGAEGYAVYGDLSARDAAQQVYADVRAHDLAVDILVLNASVELRRPWQEITDEEFDLQMDTNYRSPLKLMQLFVPDMCARGKGRVITVGSVQQKKPHEAMLVYSASKAALMNTALSLAAQLAPQGVTVNNIAPGAICTDRNAEALADPAYEKKVEGLIPMHRIGAPSEIAAAAVFIASDESGYMTGQDIYVDGGKSL